MSTEPSDILHNTDNTDHTTPSTSTSVTKDVIDTTAVSEEHTDNPDLQTIALPKRPFHLTRINSIQRIHALGKSDFLRNFFLIKWKLPTATHAALYNPLTAPQLRKLLSSTKKRSAPVHRPVFTTEADSDNNEDTDYIPPKNVLPSVNNGDEQQPSTSYDTRSHHDNLHNNVAALSQSLRFDDTIRVMTKRYDLCIAPIRYVEIGINAQPSSFVQIVIGDDRGKQLLLSYDLWLKLMHHRHHIESLAVAKHAPPVVIDNLLIDSGKFYYAKVVRFSIGPTTVHFQPEPLKQLFALYHCIHHVNAFLNQHVSFVNARFVTFVGLLQACDLRQRFNSSHNIDWNRAAKIISTSQYFNSASLVDLELISLALSNIVYYALQ